MFPVLLLPACCALQWTLLRVSEGMKLSLRAVYTSEKLKSMCKWLLDAHYFITLLATFDGSQEERRAGGVRRTPPALRSSWVKRRRR